MTVRDFVLIAHIMVFAAWFGTDMATFYLSRKVLDPSFDLPVRGALAKVMLGVEVVARLCLPMTLALGLTLSIDLGYLDVSRSWIFPLWVLVLCWVGMVWAIHRDGGTGGGAAVLSNVDLSVRSVVCIGVLVAGLWTVIAGAPFSAKWLGAKVLAFGTIMASGIAVRFLLRPFSVAFGALMVGGSSPERERDVRVSLRRAYPCVMLIWAMLLTAVVFAVWKP